MSVAAFLAVGIGGAFGAFLQKQGNVLFETPLSWTIPVAHAVH